jgi:hypothetical protein
LSFVTQLSVITVMAANQDDHSKAWYYLGKCPAENDQDVQAIAFTQPLAHTLNTQGLDGFDVLITLTDKDIKELCTNVRKPGGTIPNPAYDAANPVAGVPLTLPNPGVPMGLPHEKLLRQLGY